jgi:hypothetical protein
MLPVRFFLPVVLVAALGASCSHHDPTTELEVLDIETYWIVDSPRDGENFVAPAVRFRLRNRGSESLSSVQARARFPGTAEEDPWGSIQQQVSYWREPLGPGEDRLVTIRSIGRYQAAAEPEDMLNSPAFEDPRAEIFVRISNSSWAMLAETTVLRRIGAPGVEELVGP